MVEGINLHYHNDDKSRKRTIVIHVNHGIDIVRDRPPLFKPIFFIYKRYRFSISNKIITQTMQSHVCTGVPSINMD